MESVICLRCGYKLSFGASRCEGCAASVAIAGSLTTVDVPTLGIAHELSRLSDQNHFNVYTVNAMARLVAWSNNHKVLDPYRSYRYGPVHEASDHRYDNMTLLMCACFWPRISADVIRHLIDVGFDINATTTKDFAYRYEEDMMGYRVVSFPHSQRRLGFTPLFFAVESNHVDAAKVLIEAGVNTKVKDRDGKTALDYVKEKKHINKHVYNKLALLLYRAEQ